MIRKSGNRFSEKIMLQKEDARRQGGPQVEAMNSISKRWHSRPSMIAALGLIAIGLWLPADARAEQPFSFDTTPGKLPKIAVPTHYAIELVPDLQALTADGSEVIDIDVRETAWRLQLNAANLAIAQASIDDGAQRAEIALDPKAETATLTFPTALNKGPHRLRLGFTAKINPFGRGLFFADYPTEAGSKRMISTQLEPADARRIFPCWDEPAFKATFALTVTVPQNFLAVSNMPIAKEEPLADGRKRVVFPPTPEMSSYLFVLSAGELERITADVDGVTVGVVATSGKAEKGRFALENAVKLLGWYNDYFGSKYPLPKLDLIAVPGGFGGAMENWGGITFFESRLLFDPTTTPDSARRRIFSVLAHEMAHQWFGDLVTTAWWDNLWLNEGFASWMQEKAAEHFYPQWKSWLNGYNQKQTALALDARRTSHPIQQPVADHSVAMTAFDPITYNKGQAFIRMLENYLGEEAFRDGIRHYMQAHAYGNATTADLWEALEHATGKQVGAIAASFTEQEGVPLVIAETICDGEAQRLTLKQERFTIIPSQASATPPLLKWQVPVTTGKVGATESQKLLLDGSAEIAAGKCGDAVMVNFGDIGYYRVDYGERLRAALAKQFAQMTPQDRVNFLADDWAMVQAGRAEPASYLALVDTLPANDARAVWDEVLNTLSGLDRLARERPEQPELEAYARAKLRPVLDRLGWDGSGAGDDDDTLLRSNLIGTLGDLRDADTVAEARRRFAAFLKDPTSLPPALREFVSHVVGVSARREDYSALLTLARKSTETNERVRYYYAAASARDDALAQDTLALTLTRELPSTLVNGLINQVAASGWHRELAWDFVQNNLAALTARQGPDFPHQFVPNFMTNFSDEAHADALRQFAPAQETLGGRVMTSRALESIAIAAGLKARALPAIDAWIKAHPAKP
jgi:aminopeptidase N